jgi:GNAT superfamily N-acetyltransferase
MEIRARVRENTLRDPSRVTMEDVCWFVDNPGIFVWVEDTKVVGFSAADPRNGNIFALFVEEAYEGRGIARPFRTCLQRPRRGRLPSHVAYDMARDTRRTVLSQGRMASDRQP